MSHGPWIAPELHNGRQSLQHDPFLWRIDKGGGIDMRGYLVSPEDESLPVMQFNSIYRHFFGGPPIAMDNRDLDGNVYVTKTWIDDDGWLHVRKMA